MKIPTEDIARTRLEAWAGKPVRQISRFAMGSHHYVYDAILTDGRAIVVRMTVAAERSAMEGALSCNNQLRGLGIPLPEIHFSALNDEFPYLIMQRLPGTDLGIVLDAMPPGLQQILAVQLMRFQRQVGQLPGSGRYGYSSSPEAAPFETWTEVLAASLDRSRSRMLAAKVVDPACIRPVQQLFALLSSELQGVPASPFLHDITTKNVIIHDGRLSGIVDVDDYCYGDPLWHIALTRMAVLSRGGNTHYIDVLCDAFGPHSAEHLRLYTAIFCIDFLAELGQAFNGNTIDGSDQRKAHLMAILDGLLSGKS